ncbi:hypothetical protein LOD99_10410 [Oopsacas minuta]|uniref:RNA polymerase II-associated protein 1 n=1 Tax=Oopsacas minuta TaxID=111878 RepID=A0AAV7KFZ5_9METZ|nr:hypothetical protein LOD99_10410 [Oopsacas minuta]
MTKEEILEEQEKLRASLDPNLLNFLQNRKRKKDIPSEEINKELSLTPQLESSNLNAEVLELIGEAKRQKWKHFDTIEPEKLEWMQTNESESEKLDSSQPRFNFEGQFIQLDNDRHLETGLFHHGDEITRPGYTLEELVHLADSSFQSQKILSLQTLAFIARNAQNDIFSEKHLDSNLLKILMDIGIPMIFRIAMDNPTLSIICIGILGIRNLLVNTNDCDFIDKIKFTTLGISLPLLNTNSQSSKDEEQDSTDLELLQEDLVQGLIKTNILTRIKYIIETVRPPPTSIVCCLEILTHITRYAKSTAIQVVSADKLLELILRNFLPFMVTFEKEAGSYGQCCVEVVKLCYHLVVVNKVCANLLVGKVRLFETLLQFALLEPNNFTENNTQITELIISSLQTLRALACYGIGIDYFQTGYETFVQKLQYNLTKYTELNENDMNCLASLIQYISEISLALAFSKEHSIELINPIIQLILGISQKATLSLQVELKFSQQRIVSAVFYFFTILTHKSIISKFQSPVELVSHLESYTTTQYTSIYQNKLLRLLFNNLLNLSVNSNTSIQYSPTLLRNTEVSNEYIITTDLIYNLISFQMSISFQLSHLKIQSLYHTTGLYDVIIKYLRSIVAQYNRTQTSPAFYLQEIPIIYKLMVLYERQLEFEVTLCHDLIFLLTTNLYPGQDYYLNNLINYYLFKPKFYQKNAKLTSDELQSILRTYTALLQFVNVTPSTIDDSEAVYNRNRVSINSLSLPTFTTPLFPIDWLTMPIFILYNKEESKPNIPGGFQTHLRFLTDCLKYYNWIETNDIEFLNVMYPSTRIARVLVALMLGDIFLTDEISLELTKILQTYSRKEFIKKIDFTQIQGVTNFCELYSEICSHFTSVSFGDPTYAQFILLPLISNPPTSIKLIIWQNNTEIFRLFPIPIQDISLPITGLLEPYETETQVLTCMIQMLLQNKLRATWSPIFYFIAIHHIRHFIRTEPEDSNENSIGINFIIALFGAEYSLFQDFICYDEESSLTAMNFKKKNISEAKLQINIAYKYALENCEEIRNEVGETRISYIHF